MFAIEFGTPYDPISFSVFTQLPRDPERERLAFVELKQNTAGMAVGNRPGRPVSMLFSLRIDRFSLNARIPMRFVKDRKPFHYELRKPHR